MPTSPKPISHDLYLLKSLLPLSLTNTNILHLNRLLSSTTHLDALLSTLQYTLSLLSTLPPYAGPAAALATLISRARTTLRLTGLIGIWAGAVALWSAPPRDLVLHAIAWAQTGAGALFQALENLALLADTRVLRVRDGKRKALLWRWSSRAWMAWVGLEAGRLAREWMLETGVELKGGRKEDEKEKEGEGIQGATGREEEAARREMRHIKWWRQAIVTGASLPLTLHSSVDEGLLGDRWVGALGLVAGGMALEKAWRETA